MEWLTILLLLERVVNNMVLEKYKNKVMKVYWDKKIGAQSDKWLDYDGGAYLIMEIVEKARYDKNIDLCEFVLWCDELHENGVL